MNCKPGDLAIIVSAPLSHDLLGHIVEVVGPYRERLFVDDAITGEFSWEVRYPDGRPIAAAFGARGRRELRPSRAFRDSALRPIRGQDVDDETLTSTGKPADIKTPSPVAA